MSQENVVPFEGRRGMTRRGSPDKAFSSEVVEGKCPDCGARICFGPDSWSGAEIPCGGCGARIGLADLAGECAAAARTGD